LLTSTVTVNVTAMIWISGPFIGNLCGRTRKWAHERLRQGSFGPVTLGPSGVLYAPLTGVEHFTCLTFTPEQIARAAEGRHGRVFHIPEPEKEAVHGVRTEA
jgi:hypothetical protein